jgi:predicted glycoside hydrolase/deacetylase ChbG (UPF0249 family)
MKYLITNADDYGYRSDINKAIIDAHVNGVLTSTTVLINFVSPEGITLTNEAPYLGLGLHLNLTSGEPISPNWKKKYGDFSRPHRNQPKQFDQEEWLPVFSAYKTADIFEEYEAQINKFIMDFGKKPTHLDTHHYHSSFKTVFPAFLELAQKYQIPVRQPVLWANADKQHPMGNITHQPHLVKEILRNNIKTTHFFSLEYLNRYTNYYPILAKELKHIEDEENVEISFHPGYEEEWRKKDLEILKNPAFHELLHQEKIKLITFADLA